MRSFLVFILFAQFAIFLFFNSLDTKTKKWEPIKSMKMGRSNFAATVMDECIYVVGCFSNSSKSVEKYDPKRDDWISLAEVNRFRMHFTLVSSNGFLYAMGSDKTVERYNPVENEWQMVCRTCRPFTRNNISDFTSVSFPRLVLLESVIEFGVQYPSKTIYL